MVGDTETEFLRFVRSTRTSTADDWVRNGVLLRTKLEGCWDIEEQRRCVWLGAVFVAVYEPGVIPVGWSRDKSLRVPDRLCWEVQYDGLTVYGQARWRSEAEVESLGVGVQLAFFVSPKAGWFGPARVGFFEWNRWLIWAHLVADRVKQPRTKMRTQTAAFIDNAVANASKMAEWRRAGPHAE